MTTDPITPADHERIAAAIRAAEARTSGEIYCVLARSSDSYFFAAALVAAVSMLVAALPIALAVEAWWFSIRLPVFAGLELLAYLAVLVCLRFLPGLARRLVPRAWQYARASDNARKQFLARNVHLTADRTGVLIFVSLAERYAEVLADSGIDSKVTQADWDGIVAGLVRAARAGHVAEGFVTAVEGAGALLATHFPVRPDDRNELDDHLVEI